MIFSYLEEGKHSIEPDFTGLKFYPPKLTINNGNYAPDIVSDAMELNDGGCVHKNFADEIVLTDTRSHDLVLFTKEIIEKYQKTAEALPKREEKDLNLSFIGVLDRMNFAYTNILKRSQALPKVVLGCDGREDCEDISLV